MGQPYPIYAFTDAKHTSFYQFTVHFAAAGSKGF